MQVVFRGSTVARLCRCLAIRSLLLALQTGKRNKVALLRYEKRGVRRTWVPNSAPGTFVHSDSILAPPSSIVNAAFVSSTSLMSIRELTRNINLLRFHIKLELSVLPHHCFFCNGIARFLKTYASWENRKKYPSAFHFTSPPSAFLHLISF